MAKYIVALVFLFGGLSLTLSGQVGINIESADPSAALDMYASDKGFLLSRVVLLGTKDVVTIKTPATGLLVFNTSNANGGGINGDAVVADNLYYWTGTEWSLLVGTSIITSLLEEKLRQLRIPKPAVFELQSQLINFLNGVSGTTTQRVPMRQLVNSIPEYISFNSTTTQITFQPGTYKISFVYEATHNNGTDCTLSSYFVDFPKNTADAVRRIYATAPHTWGEISNHGAPIVSSVRLTQTVVWTIAMGRGASGNCTGAGNTLLPNSTHLTILRMGD
ncbi:hypothetical protein [Dysgonomonas alginatilytica]|nr:hypothetical protein [Dysgonomonas alginatilytica]